MRSLLESSSIDDRTSFNQSLLDILEDQYHGVEAQSFTKYVKERLVDMNERIIKYSPENYSGQRAEKERMEIYSQLVELSKILKTAKCHPDIMRKTPKEFITQSLTLILKQKKKLKQKSLIIMGYPTPKTERKSAKNRAKAKNHRNNNEVLNDTELISSRKTAKKVDMNETRKKSSKRYHSELDDEEETQILNDEDQALTRIQSKYEMVNSIIKDTSDIQEIQAGHIDGINSKLDRVVRRMKKGKEAVKDALMSAEDQKFKFAKFLFYMIILAAFLGVIYVIKEL